MPDFEPRGMRVARAEDHAVLGDVRKEYEECSKLMVFAVDKYKNLDNLSCAVADGKLVIETYKKFGFDVACALFNEEVTQDAIAKEVCRGVYRRYARAAAWGARLSFFLFVRAVR